jgi:hypothetical protein
MYGGATAGVEGGADASTDQATAVDAEADPDATTDVDESWLDGAVLGAADVDEDALAVAMAEDELADMTPDEMALLEAGLVLGGDSTQPDDEEQEL